MDKISSHIKIYPFILSILMIIGLLIVYYGYENTFMLWGVPTLSPEFADLRTITGGAETLAEGIDPYIENPNDPWLRQMNYPRIWLLIAHLGIDQSHTIYLGAFFVSLFFVGLLIFYNQRLRPREIVISLIAIFSPSVMLTIERGNNDMLIFFLVALAVYFINRSKNNSAIISFIVIVLGFVLKLFPIFSFIIFVREKGSVFQKYIFAIIIIVIVYILLTYSDLFLIFRNTPKDPYLSYGMNVLWQAIVPMSETLSHVFRVISSFLVFSSIFVFRYGLKIADKAGENSKSISASGFLAGATIYIGTFIIGSNFDYRLIFLLFTIPYLFDLVRVENKSISIISIVSIWLILISLWHAFISNKIYWITGRSFPALILDEIANWLLYFAFVYLIAYVLPEKIKLNNSFRKMLRL